MPSLDPQAVNLWNKLDNFAHLRNKVREIAEERGEYAGIPMPIEGHPLVIEPEYALGRGLEAIGKANHEPLPEGFNLRNVFWSKRYQSDIYIWDEPDGTLHWAAMPRSRFELLANTIDCAYAWGLEQEARAIQLLGTLIKHHQFKMYMLTGVFVESSKRSGIMYMFRKGRPTLALSSNSPGDRAKCLCALCMHPIGYYEDSFAGAMTPTDDVIAHLQLMRADEPMFWRRCNQHSPTHPNAGI